MKRNGAPFLWNGCAVLAEYADKTELIVEAGINVQKQFAQNVLSGLTEEETHMCIKVFNKICNNAEEYLRKYKERVDES